MSILARLHRIYQRLLNISGSKYCPVCDHTLRNFYPFGDPPRPYARCPHCCSLERHRLDWLFFKERTDLFNGTNKLFLHIAPEEFLSERIRAIPGVDYLSGDLNNPNAMEKMDVTSIEYPDGKFAAIYCSHVLEHISEDRKALAEFYRVMAPGGWAILQVPITADKTYEDSSIRSPEDRKQHFGQWDHVRRCGPDYIERLRDAGFVAETVLATDLSSRDGLERMGIQPGRIIFYCRKVVA